MKSIADRLKKRRVEIGLSQQELADKTKLSLRTIQRIENNETQPRDITLQLLYNVLDLKEDFTVQHAPKKVFANRLVDVLLYICINVLLMMLVGLFTIDSFATTYTRIAGVLLSFFVPYFIVSRTLHLESLTRLLRFGSGYFVYVLLLFAFQGYERGFFAGWNKGLFVCVLISVFTLYYAASFFQTAEKNKSDGFKNI
jgi:transcriptional regulator with XRE-family HTH domain